MSLCPAPHLWQLDCSVPLEKMPQLCELVPLHQCGFRPGCTFRATQLPSCAPHVLSLSLRSLPAADLLTRFFLVQMTDLQGLTPQWAVASPQPGGPVWNCQCLTGVDLQNQQSHPLQANTCLSSSFYRSLTSGKWWPSSPRSIHPPQEPIRCFSPGLRLHQHRLASCLLISFHFFSPWLLLLANNVA